MTALLALAGLASATAQITPPTVEHPAAPVVTKVVPLSAAEAPAEPALASSDFIQPDPELTPFHRMTRTRVLGNLSMAEVAIIGGVLIGLTSYFRRRHRRRIGWAFMPDRSLGRARSDS
ncbi:MAG: hypothetical protein H7268_09510 [Sandarakinorhabdus sp.]|nr:hypothetical protein [Sandarakinorhabdus sp.]